jgi:hypothetical protein
MVADRKSCWSLSARSYRLTSSPWVRRAVPSSAGTPVRAGTEEASIPVIGTLIAATLIGSRASACPSSR